MSVWFRFRWHTAALRAMAFACFALTASAVDKDFSSLTKRLQAEKPKFAQRQQALLSLRHTVMKTARCKAHITIIASKSSRRYCNA